ncbi:MAG: Na-translocating system protein MpsC family protein [Solirubrobacteraceae bacterium]
MPAGSTNAWFARIASWRLYDVLTRAEKSPAGSDRFEVLGQIRDLFQKTTEDDVREAIGRLTGRTALALFSGNESRPDVAAELFILDAAL